MFGRRKAQQAQEWAQVQQDMEQAEVAAVQQVFRAAVDITFPGHVITPEDVKRAAQMLATQVVTTAVQSGSSPRVCSEIAATYAFAGDAVAAAFGPGGEYHGYRAPGGEEWEK